MELQGTHLINGVATSASEILGFHGWNPATGHPLPPEYRNATPEEIDRAMAVAQDACTELADLPESRAQLLLTIAAGIEELGDALLDRAHQETALPLPRLANERLRTVTQLRLFADLVRDGSYVDARIDTALPDRAPPRPDLRRMLIPIGPVAVFGASNFPLAFSVAGGDTASALAAGCPVVVKGHPAHPGTSEWVGRIIQKAVAQVGLPPGCFALLHGEAPDVSVGLVRHPATQAVAFTGSLRGGRALLQAAMSRPEPIPVFAEMGSQNPVVILPGAVGERGPSLAQGLAQSACLGVGQFCTSPGLVLMLRDPSTDLFLEHVERAFRDIPDGTMLHRGIRAGYEETVKRLEDTAGVDAKGRARSPLGVGATGCTPAVFVTDSATFRTRPTLSEEVFGPTTLFVVCSDRKDLRELCQGLPGQLTATLHGTEAEVLESRDLLRSLRGRAGRLIINGFPTGVEVSAAMQHGGPYPATSDSRFTSVGPAAIERFLRPVTFQDVPEHLLPPELRSGNPRGIWRQWNGTFTRDSDPSLPS